MAPDFCGYANAHASFVTRSECVVILKWRVLFTLMAGRPISAVWCVPSRLDFMLPIVSPQNNKVLPASSYRPFRLIYRPVLDWPIGKRQNHTAIIISPPAILELCSNLAVSCFIAHIITFNCCACFSCWRHFAGAYFRYAWQCLREVTSRGVREAEASLASPPLSA